MTARLALAVAAIGIGIGLTTSGTAVLPAGSVVVAAQQPAGVTGPVVGQKVAPKLSLAVRDLPPAPPPTGREVNPLQHDPSSTPVVPGPQQRDPIVQLSAGAGTRSLDLLGAPIVNVPGQGGANPNDTNGDVGPNDYVQMINSQFRIYDKQGNPRAAAAAINTLWTSVNPADTSACATQNAGDPIVLYDNMADRWLLSQFAQTQFICIAISQTADPTGAYYLYQFDTGRFPDYFKIGAWPDGYYVSANLGGPNEALAAVFDRANMLNGNPAGSVQFAAPTLVNNFDILIPSDVDGFTEPPFGTPNYMYRPHDEGVAPTGGVDRLEVWEFHVDWIVPANSTFTGPVNIPTAPFDSTTCGYVFPSDCIPQPGTAQLITAIPFGGMYRFPYRNYGDREVLAGNFTVDANGADGVGIRWFILERSGGGAWTVANEGTYAPQPVGAPAFVHRWMGSLAMDRFGNLALGYSRSSSQDPGAAGTGNPSAFYTGRTPGDPLGLLPQPEILIQQGQGVTGSDRWGDYYTMNVDPVDDCTFWYTGDATAANGSRQSRIASFRFSSCATDLRITKVVIPSHPNAGEEIVYRITVYNDGPINAQNVVVTDVLPAQVSYLANTDACTGVAVGGTGTLTCQLGTILSGQNRLFEIKVRINPSLGGATSITNTATVTGDPGESDPSDNTVSLTHLVNELADLAVTKTCKPDTTSAPAGTTTNCAILVANNGPSAARSVTLTDTNVSNGSFTIGAVTTTQGACATASGVVTCNLGTILPAASARIDVSITSSEGVDVNDIARATSPTPDPDLSNNEAMSGVSFEASADLVITKSGPATVPLDGTFTYTLSVDNLGPSTAANVVVTDVLPAGVEFVSAAAAVGTINVVNGTLTWMLGTVAVADPVRTIDITVHVLPSTSATLVNNASVTSATPDPNGANNQATTTTQVNGTDLWIAKSGAAPAGNPAGALVYRITVFNRPGFVTDSTPTSGNGGPNAAQNVVVTDTLPLDNKKLVVQFMSPGCAYDSAAHTVTCTAASLAAGTDVTFEIQVQIKGSVGTIANSVSVTSDTFDPNLSNNADTVNNTVKGSTGTGPRPR